MSHPCQYPVYVRQTGETKKSMLAVFGDRTDAVNYAHAQSCGKYNFRNMTLLVLNHDRKVFMKFKKGIRQ